MEILRKTVYDVCTIRILWNNNFYWLSNLRNGLLHWNLMIYIFLTTIDPHHICWLLLPDSLSLSRVWLLLHLIWKNWVFIVLWIWAGKVNLCEVKAMLCYVQFMQKAVVNLLSNYLTIHQLTEHFPVCKTNKRFHQQFLKSYQQSTIV